MALHCTMQNTLTFYQDLHFPIPNPELRVEVSENRCDVFSSK